MLPALPLVTRRARVRACVCVLSPRPSAQNWALMGVGAGRGMIHITDMDRIERSNLSRQFLFREQHIGTFACRC